MKDWKRLFYFLLLNVMVSACTVLVVLLVWEQVIAPGSGSPGQLTRALRSLTERRLPTAVVPVATSLPGDTAAPAPTPTRTYVNYTVKEGDSLESIAEMYGLSVEQLMRENGIPNPGPLAVNDLLLIPLDITPKPSAAGSQPGEVVIDSVVGVGDINNEYVTLRHVGDQEVSLVGWRLEDGDGNVFLFPEYPQLTLYKNGAVNINTRQGVNSVVEMFWGQPAAIWRSGETVTLRDPQGEVRATYTIP